MRIARVSLTPYACAPLARWPSGSAREGVILTLEEEDGTLACGESAPLPVFGMETPASSIAALRLAAKFLIGMPRERYRDAVADLHRLAPVAASPGARHAIDLALHGLMASSARRPIARLLGDLAAVDEVPVNAALPRLPQGETLAMADLAVLDGYRTLKLKVGGAPVAEDVARVRAVRDRVGPDVRLRIDANRAWSERQAFEALTALASAGLEYCEEPVSDPGVMARLRAATPVAIAADESVADLESARRLLDRRAADVLVLKPMALGGLHPARAIATLAREAGVDVVVTTMLESPVGRLGALHLAASLGPALYAHGLGVGCVPWTEERALDPPIPPRTRSGPARTLRVGRDEGLGASFRSWQSASADFVQTLLEEEV